MQIQQQFPQQQLDPQIVPQQDRQQRKKKTRVIN